MKEKLTITAYKNVERNSPIDDYECYLPPEAIQLGQTNEFTEVATINGSLPLTAFASGGQNTMTIDLILDGSGAHAVSGGKVVSVAKQLMELRELTVQFDGALHQPPFLRVVWGQLPPFDCRAQSLTTSYKTFNPEGTIIHAVARLVLVQDIDEKLLQRMANRQSPDLYHYHQVGPGETLPLLAHKYYNDTRHLLVIARQNRLSNLYALKAGTTLIIPPLKPATP